MRKDEKNQPAPGEKRRRKGKKNEKAEKHTGRPLWDVRVTRKGLHLVPDLQECQLGEG